MNPVVRALQQAERGRGKHTHACTHTRTQPFPFLQGAAEAVWSQQPLHGSMTYFETMLPSPVMVKNPSLALSRFISHIPIPVSRCLTACTPSLRCNFPFRFTSLPSLRLSPPLSVLGCFFVFFPLPSSPLPCPP